MPAFNTLHVLAAVVIGLTGFSGWRNRMSIAVAEKLVAYPHAFPGFGQLDANFLALG